MLKHFLRRSPFSRLQIKGDRQNPQANQNSDRCFYIPSQISNKYFRLDK
ncbi:MULTISPECIES: hypothetical protein [Pseudanabaena]|uniref:Uncharacterized protein n=1 Tax=Pseudanabaena catenata USMAC16 TaxID=1855837 RepID=A0A9X4RGY1_9CYAN|nr:MULTISPECIES: hypothetical protein [Pseudanabaena]MDG3493891.1 hypothetical protein [Pseudanabaena catenata USMAC16]